MGAEVSTPFNGRGGLDFARPPVTSNQVIKNLSKNYPVPERNRSHADFLFMCSSGLEALFCQFSTKFFNAQTFDLLQRPLLAHER
jgi:hypothetical protein